MRTKLVVLVLLGIGLFAGLLLIWNRESEPNPPEGVRCFRDTKLVAVRPGQEGWGKAGYQVVQFVREESGAISAPILLVVRPNFRGFMGGVRHDPIWETTFHFLGDGQAKLDVPVHPLIDEHLILVRILPGRGMTPDGPWRLWTVKPFQFGADIEMPTFQSLEMYLDRKDLGDLIELNQRAEEFAMNLGL